MSPDPVFWTDASACDRRDLRNMLGSFMTGVTVVATRDETGAPRGFTANSFTSVSLDPALVLVCLARTAQSAEAFCAAECFSINILADSQRALSGAFASSTPAKAAALAGLSPEPVPHVSGSLATMICARERVIDAGDHLILIGAVQSFQLGQGQPLGYFRGAYVGFGLAARHLESLAAPLIVGGLVEWQGKVLLCRRPGDRLWSLPQAHPVAGVGHARSLADTLLRLGVSAAPSFLYSVYQEVGEASTTMIFNAVPSEPLRPGFTEDGTEVALFSEAEAPWGSVAGEMAEGLLRRFFQERQSGRLGLYCDSAEGGSVIPLAGPPQPWGSWSA